MSSETAIEVASLSKRYLIYEKPADRLKQSVMPRIQRALGRPTKSYFREFWALRDVTFDVQRGETVGIVGRNGSGKSTLLQLICGTLDPSLGTVVARGRVAALLELGSGFNPEFTGRENVFLNAAILGLGREEVEARYEQILAFAEIGEFIDRPVKTYSSGMIVRLAFAVIAHVDAEVLIIDEALSVGDAFFVQKCMRFLRAFMERGTVLFVSHDTSAVLALCQRAVWLRSGSVAEIGTPKEITEAYLRELYAEKSGGSFAEAPGAREGAGAPVAVEQRDMRAGLLNASNLRNDIELFRFQPDAPSFGHGGAQVEQVEFLDREGHHLLWVVGGEPVSLRIRCVCNEAIGQPIVGFLVKDRLGQALFGDNTYLAYLDERVDATPGSVLAATFSFVMPYLPAGDYTVTVAISEGTQSEHTPHQWIHDALAFKSHSTSVSHGLVGIPMTAIEMSVETMQGVPGRA